MTTDEAKKMLMEMYPGRLYIGRKEVSALLDLSTATLDRRLKKDNDLARIAKRERRRVLFPIPELARILADER